MVSSRLHNRTFKRISVTTAGFGAVLALIVVVALFNEAPSLPRPILTTSATALNDLYVENAVKANDEIGQSQLEISGLLDQVDDDRDGGTLYINAGIGALSLQAHMDDSQRKDVATLQTGELVSVFCDSVDYAGLVEAWDCTLLSRDKKIAQISPGSPIRSIP